MGGIKDPSIQSNLGLQGAGKIAGYVEMALYPIAALHAMVLSKLPVIGGLITGAMNWLSNGLFGGNTKQEVTGGGIQTGATNVGNIINGQSIGGQQYTTVKKTVDGGWFRSDKVSYSEILSGLDASVTESMTSIYKAMGSTMLSLATAFGGDLIAQVNATIIPALKVELRGLSGADAAKVLNGVISATLDTMATNVFGGILKQYQQLGEGMLETAIRIASEIAVVKDALAASGMSIADNAIAISDAMVQAAGGLAEFKKNFETFVDKFFTDAQKIALLKKGLDAQFLTVEKAMPVSRTAYLDYFNSLKPAVDGLTITLLQSLSTQIDDYYTRIEGVQKKYTDNIASAYKTVSDILTTTISKLSSFVASLKTLKDSLALGNLSPGTPLDKYNEARRQAGDAYVIIHTPANFFHYS